jgi:SAM-dependent methyltransferase
MTTQTVSNKELYDENWDAWHEMKVYGPASRWLRALIRDMLDHVAPGAIRRALDVGCGQGTTTDLLARRFPSASVLGIDFSETGIACARRHYQHPNLAFEADLTSQRLQDGPYDLVTCFEVLEHVEDWRALVTRMAAASNRYLLASFPTGRMRPYEVHVGHVRNFVIGELEGALAPLGFEPVSVYYAGFPFYSPVYRWLCNLTDSANNAFTKGRYRGSQKAVAAVLYTLFRYGSTRRRRGDQFVGLFEKKQVA